MFLLFFLGLVAATGLDWLIDLPLLGSRGLLFVTLVVVVDLATRVQPIARNDKGFLIDAGRLLERVDPQERVGNCVLRRMEDWTRIWVRMAAP